MKFKSFIVTFTTFILITGLLFLVGHTFTISWLMLHYEYIDNINGFFITTGSILPLIIGLIVSFFVEKIYVYKYQQKLG